MALSRIYQSRAGYCLAMGFVGLFRPIMSFVVWTRESKLFDGVVISDWTKNPSSIDFYNAASEALALIKSWDARRYRRVIRNIEFVVNYQGLFGRRYLRAFTFCMVEYDKYFKTHDAEWNVRALACCLVQAATVGLVVQKSIPIYWKNSKRIAQLAEREAHSFAMRIDPAWASEYCYTGIDDL